MSIITLYDHLDKEIARLESIIAEKKALLQESELNILSSHHEKFLLDHKMILQDTFCKSMEDKRVT